MYFSCSKSRSRNEIEDFSPKQSDKVVTPLVDDVVQGDSERHVLLHVLDDRRVFHEGLKSEHV